MKFFKLSIILLLELFALPGYALKCQWWQTRVDGSTIPQHPRDGHTVRKHPRREHCREKWKGADTYIAQFRNDPITGWPHKEIFKAWTRSDTEELLKVLSSIPSWVEASQYQFYRSIKSDVDGNPARYEITRRYLVLYDSFFTASNKPAIVVHESAHGLYQKLSQADKDIIKYLSGWSTAVNFETRKVYETPPATLIKPDSSTSPEEDFTNHVEVFFQSPVDYQKSHPQLYKFLQERFKP